MRLRLTLHSAATIAVAVTLSVTTGADAAAQTLTNPNPPARPRPAAKPDTTAHVKSRSAYGAGLVNIPRTDACIKIGGGVTVESGINRGR